MIIEYESIADIDYYCYFVKSGTPFNLEDGTFYTIKASPHFHRNIEFLLITKGTQKVTVDGTNYSLNAGDILFVNSYLPHSYEDCDAEAFVLVLSSLYFEPFHWFYGSGVFPQLMNEKEKNLPIFAFIKKWLDEYQENQDRFNVFLRSNELFKMLAKIYQIEVPSFSKQNELIIAALKHVYVNYRDPELSLKSCSNAIGYSKEYVSKQFNNIMGVSFKAYVNSLRIKKYYELRSTKKGSKQELATMCGFKSAATFYRALKSDGKEED